MKYLVIEQKHTDIDTDDAGSVVRVHLCADSREVHAAVRGSETRGNDWSVWEVIGGAVTRRCSITFKWERVSVDVEIS